MSGDHRTIERRSSDPPRPGVEAPPPATVTLPVPPASPSPSPFPSAARVLLGELGLRATSASVPRARGFSRALLIEAAGPAPHVRQDAEVLVSELVTNAVRHAAATRDGDGGGGDSDDHDGGALRLRLLRVGARLRIEVHDPSPSVPRARHADLLEETGRGWFLVAAIADRHGTEQTSSGKSVWCEIRAWPDTGFA
ncbi:ATP-binding protein [Actinomadura miaoliensis]|uniref:Histidine kinase/HSP90-like ATPase domain-containing protein n=1 Tax=Actinomadura miaoliensis TaxID=430685 RepID=A0ABP7X3S7_9ACTN